MAGDDREHGRPNGKSSGDAKRERADDGAQPERGPVLTQQPRAGVEFVGDEHTGRDAARGAETVAALEPAGGRGRFVACDLGDLASVARLAEAGADAAVLVDNADIFAFMPTAEQDVTSFEAMFD